MHDLICKNATSQKQLERLTSINVPAAAADIPKTSV